MKEKTKCLIQGMDSLTEGGGGRRRGGRGNCWGGLIV
jgi:hypothetical protein